MLDNPYILQLDHFWRRQQEHLRPKNRRKNIWDKVELEFTYSWKISEWFDCDTVRNLAVFECLISSRDHVCCCAHQTLVWIKKSVINHWIGSNVCLLLILSLFRIIESILLSLVWLLLISLIWLSHWLVTCRRHILILLCWWWLLHLYL